MPEALANLIVRPEEPGDYAASRHINEAAFGQRDDADLVDRLREDGAALLSLVAELEGKLVGHILFSRMYIDTTALSIPAVALAPMAVTPGHQRQGIGSQLVRDGLAALRKGGERIVIVVGHAAYYPRFGFRAEMTQSVGSPFPPEVFMALELVPGALNGVRGTVRYPAAFGV